MGDPRNDHASFTNALCGIAVGPGGHLFAVGDALVKEYDGDGELRTQWETARPGFSVAVDDGGSVWVGEIGQVEIFEPEREPTIWSDGDRLGMITAIALGDNSVFLGDAHARCIHRYDRAGNWVNDIGDTHRKGGFHIPNGVVDFALDDDDVLHVANPGMHRVERWTPEGKLLGHFGRFDGQDPAGFPGCCNPTNLVLGDAGRIIVTEKAGPRAKVYDAEGKLLAVVADDVFDARAKNMDVAADREGRIYVADSATRIIHVFTPESGEMTP